MVPEDVELGKEHQRNVQPRSQENAGGHVERILLQVVVLPNVGLLVVNVVPEVVDRVDGDDGVDPLPVFVHDFNDCNDEPRSEVMS